MNSEQFENDFHSVIIGGKNDGATFAESIIDDGCDANTKNRKFG